jgi:hypothetical protein
MIRMNYGMQVAALEIQARRATASFLAEITVVVSLRWHL